MLVEELKERLIGITDSVLIEALLESGKIMELEAGTVIMEPGQFVKMVPIVLEGAIKVIRMDADGRELFLYHLEQGETCALSLTCCSAHKPSEIKAVAEESTKLLAVPVSLHEKWMDEHRQWKDFVSRTYQLRFQEMLEALDAVAFKRMDERLIRYIIAKRKQQKANELHITHQEIAQELGSSREVISRLLKQLEKKKWVELGRNVIYVRDDFEEVVVK